MKKILCIIFSISCFMLYAQEHPVVSSEMCSIEKCEEKWCLKNMDGEIVVSALDSVYYKSGVFFVEKNNAWGIVSLFGKNLIPIQFDKIKESDFFNVVMGLYDTYYMVYKQNKKGLYGIRLNYTTIIPCEYDTIKKEMGVLVLSANNKTTYAFNNKIITDSLDLDNLFQIYGNYVDDIRSYYPIYKNNFWGMIDDGGNIVISPKYQQIKSITRYGLMVKKDDLWGVIDINEKIIIPIKYQNIELFSPDYSVVSIRNHKQLYNHKTQTLLAEPKFDKIYMYSAKYSRITYDDKENLVENENNFKTVFPFVYQSVSDYGNGLFIVNKNGKYGIVDEKNTVKTPFIYNNLYFACRNKYIIAEKDNKYGILSLENKELIPFEDRPIIGYLETIEIRLPDSFEYKVCDCDLRCIQNCE